MSIINDALKKAQMGFKGPKKNEEEKLQDGQKPENDNTVNIYDKLYKDREDQSKSPSAHIAPEKELSKDDKTPRTSRKWLKTTLATLFLIASLAFGFNFLLGYEPLQDFLRYNTGKTAPSRAHLIKHMPKKQKYNDGELFLNGISIVDGTKVALINDEIYQVGDMVNNKEIISIGNNAVELRDDQTTFTIKVR